VASLCCCVSVAQGAVRNVAIRSTATTVIAAWVISLLAILLAPILLIRFCKRWVAAFNLAITNRIRSRSAARLPGFGILTHVGRKSGRVYRTPVNVFREPDGFLVALTYGRNSEWFRNALAAGVASLRPAVCSFQLLTRRAFHNRAPHLAATVCSFTQAHTAFLFSSVTFASGCIVVYSHGGILPVDMSPHMESNLSRFCHPEYFSQSEKSSFSLPSRTCCAIHQETGATWLYQGQSV
jgi:deazaflavin-dependent oxidoreductase (nitroreductase family)